jgi:hypothetical protein
MRLTSFVLVLAAACGGSHHAPTPNSNSGGTPTGAHEPLATIERTACFGWCPIYKLTVYRDGVVEYDGEDFVKTKGKATGHLAPERLTELDQLFEQRGYLALHDAYTDYSVTDMPSVKTSYSVGGKTKQVQHYLGDSTAPKELGEIEEGIDRIVQVEQWIGTEQEREDLAQHRSP